VDQVLAYLRQQAKDFKGDLVGANLPYDLDFLGGEGIEFNAVRFFRDIQVADPLINELHMSYSMQSIANRYGMEGKDESILRAAAADYKIDPKADMWILPARFVGVYGEEDARLPLRILRRQERDIEEQDLWKVYDLESKLLPILLKLRRRGVRINLDHLDMIEKWSTEEERKALNELNRLTGIKIALGDVWRAEALVPILQY
jgi:DNA polymerase I-like protein with 3'-5' exonuclease and polymerase domains